MALVVVLMVLVVALVVVVVASHYYDKESHHQDHQNHHQDHQNTLRDRNYTFQIKCYDPVSDILVLVSLTNPRRGTFVFRTQSSKQERPKNISYENGRRWAVGIPKTS